MNSFVIVLLASVAVASASYGGVILKAPTAGATLSGPSGYAGLGHAGVITAYATPGYNAGAGYGNGAGWGGAGWGGAGWGGAGWGGAGWNGVGWAAHAAPAYRAGPYAVGYAGHEAKTGTLIDGPSGQIRTNGNPNGLVAATHGYTAPGPAPAVRSWAAAPVIAVASHGNNGGWGNGAWGGDDDGDDGSYRGEGAYGKKW